MNKSNYVISGLIAVVIIGGLVMWARSRSGVPAVNNSYPAGTENTSAPMLPADTAPQGSARSAPSERPEVIDGVKMVYYTDRGFEPFIVEVKRGHDVRFVNVDNETMRLAPIDLRGHAYAGLSSSKSVGRGGSLTTNMTEAGTWGYYNLNNPADRGAVVVTE